MNKFSLIIIFTIILSGCGYRIDIIPKTNSNLKSHQIIATPVDTKKYMVKYLPNNIIIADSNISFTYSFTYLDQKTSIDFDTVNLLFNPLILVGFPMSNDVFKMAGNLRFFNDSNTINLSSVCVSNISRNLFNNTNMTNLRDKCIERIKNNLQDQINEIFERGEFNVFKK